LYGVVQDYSIGCLQFSSLGMPKVGDCMHFHLQIMPLKQDPVDPMPFQDWRGFANL
jgi:hypothetical protein